MAAQPAGEDRRSLLPVDKCGLLFFVGLFVFQGAIMEMGFVAGWGTLALINAGLAQGKGRSGLIWFITSLLLGPLATFLIVILSAVSQDEEIE